MHKKNRKRNHKINLFGGVESLDDGGNIVILDVHVARVHKVLHEALVAGNLDGHVLDGGVLLVAEVGRALAVLVLHVSKGLLDRK